MKATSTTSNTEEASKISLGFLVSDPDNEGKLISPSPLTLEKGVVKKACLCISQEGFKGFDSPEAKEKAVKEIKSLCMSMDKPGIGMGINTSWIGNPASGRTFDPKTQQYSFETDIYLLLLSNKLGKTTLSFALEKKPQMEVLDKLVIPVETVEPAKVER